MRRSILLLLLAGCLGFSAAAEEKPDAQSSEEVDPDVLRKVRKLMRGTLSEDAEEREKSWTEVRNMGNLITPGLLALCKNNETPAPMLRSILLALGDSKDPRAGSALSELLKSEDAGVRKLAARAMGDSNYKAGAAQLDAVASNEKEDEEVRLFAATSSIRLGGSKAAEVLKSLLKSGKPELRSRAVFALGKYGGIKQLDAVGAVLKDSDPSVREDAIAALGAMKERSTCPVLIDATKDDNYRVRGAAMDALRELTKQSFGNEPKEWQNWWEKHKDFATKKEPMKIITKPEGN